MERFGNVYVANGYDVMAGRLDQPFLKGRWSGVRAFADRDQYNKFIRGENVAPLFDYAFPNGITDVGMHYALEVAFRSDAMTPQAQSAPWFAGLINSSGFSAVANGDTSASHAGWTETSGYSETERQTLAFAAASSRSILASVSFSINTSVTVRGLFVIDDDTKAGATGILFSTALFGSPPSLVNGNVLTANYSLSD
jgi:hypothetical protein